MKLVYRLTIEHTYTYYSRPRSPRLGVVPAWFSPGLQFSRGNIWSLEGVGYTSPHNPGGGKNEPSDVCCWLTSTLGGDKLLCYITFISPLWVGINDIVLHIHSCWGWMTLLFCCWMALLFLLLLCHPCLHSGWGRGHLVTVDCKWNHINISCNNTYVFM